MSEAAFDAALASKDPATDQRAFEILRVSTTNGNGARGGMGIEARICSTGGRISIWWYQQLSSRTKVAGLILSPTA